MVEKRKPQESQQTQIVAVKKTKNATPSSGAGQELVSVASQQVFKTIKRTSLLEQPIMQLTGHSNSVLTCQFNSNSSNQQKPMLASAGMDKAICKLVF